MDKAQLVGQIMFKLGQRAGEIYVSDEPKVAIDARLDEQQRTIGLVVELLEEMSK